MKTEMEKRRAMTSARKRRIHARVGGKCWFCGQPVEETGPGVRYDHRVPLELTGTDDDSNIYPLHREPCDRIKTAADVARIAKARRIIAREDGTRRPRQAIPQRPNPWGPKGVRKIPTKKFRPAPNTEKP